MENVFRKIQLACTLALCAWSSALAWHEYQPMVVEGRRWLCANGLTYTILGDTIIGSQNYKKAWCYATDNPTGTLQYIGALEEHDRAVFVIYDGSSTPLQLYDFTVGKLKRESHYDLGDVCVLCVNNMVIQGQERRYIEFWDGNPNLTDLHLLIEGIGYDSDPFEPISHAPSIVLQCYDGDELIYDDYEFYMNDHEIVTDGEINGDGQVDIADVNAVLNMMLGKPLAPRWDDVAANMDLNATIDIADVNAVINAMLGK